MKKYNFTKCSWRNRIFLFFLLIIPGLDVSGQSLTPLVVTSSGGYLQGWGTTLSSTVGEVAITTLLGTENILTQGFQQPPVHPYELDIKVFLEGPALNGEMYSYLNLAGLLPLAQPYLGSPWYYPGIESVGIIPNDDVIDWVLIEIRETSGGASTATSDKIIMRKAALLLKDGSVVDLDGISKPVAMLDFNDDLYCVVRHRNHVGVMSASPVNQIPGNILQAWFYDNASSAYGGILAHKEVEPGLWAMVAADGDGSGQINNQDKLEVWAPQAGSWGYYSGDFNMDMNVSNVDKNDYWIPNSGLGSQVPESTPPGGFKTMIPD